MTPILQDIPQQSADTLRLRDGVPWLYRGRIPSLDGLRAVAVAMVVLGHASHTVELPLQYHLYMGLMAEFGVTIFFVLSGFLITNLMLREEQRTQSIDLKSFYLRRILRIIPAYAALLIAVAVLARLGLAAPTRTDWIAACTYTVNFVPHPVWELGHCWSLSIEEHFYLLWPAAMLVATRCWRARLAIIAIVGSCALRIVIIAFAPQLMKICDNWTFCRIDSIACGCLLAIWAWDAGKQRLFHRMNISFGAAITALILSMLLSRSGKYSFGLSYTVNSICIAVIVWNAAVRQTKALNWTPTVWLGTLSYSIYLWQQLFLDRNRADITTRFPLNIGFALCAAIISYYLIETPFLTLKDRIQQSDPGHHYVQGIHAP